LDQLEKDGRSPKSRPLTNRLLVRADDRIVMIKTDEIIWVEAAGNYVRIHTRKETYIIRESISRLEAILDPAQFARIHRSTLINLDSVKEMQPWFSGEMLVIMNDGTQLKLSRTYRRQFEQHNRILS
jgi:two-component system LytT family response regulator